MSAVRTDIAGQRLLFLLGFVAAAWLVGATGGQFSAGAWYAGLHKPLITPPDAVFRLVWALLYTLTGLAAWLAWDAQRRLRRAHALWVGHLVLTAIWPWLFFGLHRMDLALAAVLVQLLVMLFLLADFWRIRPLACAPLLPYFAWLLFAALLNVAFVGLN